jgi:HK97 family phage portal protein
VADSIFKRVGEATRAAVGIFTNTDVRRTWNLFNGILPGGLGTPPNRYTRDYLKSYSQMPWLRAVGGKIAFACAQVEWKLNTKTATDKKTGIKKAVRDARIQRSSFEGRERLLKQANDDGDLKEIVDHPLLDVLNNANEFQTGLQMRKVTQLHLDLAGEAFWLKERDTVLGHVVGVWPIPPDWIMNTPTPHNPFFRVGFRGWQGMIPDTEFLWFQDTDPVNPYARGTGTAQALSDELETDEYAAKHTKAFFYNRAKPDLLIFPKTGNLREDAVKRLETDWMNSNQGFWRAFKPYFMTREVGVHEMDQNFRAMQLVQLREFERDIILQTFGLPPELLGVLAHSNRSTIDAASYLMARYVVQPRLEFMRTILQEKFVPEYDDRLIITYESPVEEDHEAKLNAAKAAPQVLSVDEWRELAGKEPLEAGKGGDLHSIPTLVTMQLLTDAKKQADEQHAADIAPPPAPIIAPGAERPGFPKPGAPKPKPGAKPLPPKPAAKPKQLGGREPETEEDSQYSQDELVEVSGALKYRDDQPRDEHGRWTSGGDMGLGESTNYPPHNPRGKDTREMFKRADGTYTPERAALHEQILNEYLAGHAPQAHPEATFLGGGPASGKSHIAGTLIGPTDAVHVDVDMIRGHLPEYQEGVRNGDRGASARVHEEASDVGRMLIDRAVTARNNVLVDGTGDSSIESLTSKVQRLSDAGHVVNATYVTVDTNEAVRRAEERGAKTGRFVPETFIRDTHAAVSRVLPQAVAHGLFHTLNVYDTSNGVTKIASAEGNKLTIHDHEAWSRFIAKGRKSYADDGRHGAHHRGSGDQEDAAGHGHRGDDLPPGGAEGRARDSREGRYRGDSPRDALKYAEDEARDDHGRWTNGGGDDATDYLSTPSDAVESLANGEVTNIAPEDVRGLLERMATRTDHPDLTDLHVDGMQIFGGNGLGIARADMPQIPQTHVDRFEQDLRDQGVRIQDARVSPLSLKPSQKEISAVKAAQMMAKFEKDKKIKDIYVSKDNYVLDGHHRWAALAALSIEQSQLKMPIKRLMVDHTRALSLMLNFTEANDIANKPMGKNAQPWVKFDEDEARDDHGRWTSGGGGDVDVNTFFERLSHPDGGFTVSATTGEEPTGPGHYAVSPYPEAALPVPLDKLTPKDLAGYIKSNMALLSKDEHYFGGWHDPETHTVYLDVSHVVTSPDAAMKLAKEHDQLAYFDFGTGKSVRVDAAKALHFKAPGKAHLVLLKVHKNDLNLEAVTLGLFKLLAGRPATAAEVDELRASL